MATDSTLPGDVPIPYTGNVDNTSDTSSSTDEIVLQSDVDPVPGTFTVEVIPVQVSVAPEDVAEDTSTAGPLFLA